MLIGLAYRLLGSRAEAEDVVQDTFLAWSGTDRAVIEQPRAWLSSVCTRRALDVLNRLGAAAPIMSVTGCRSRSRPGTAGRLNRIS